MGLAGKRIVAGVDEWDAMSLICGGHDDRDDASSRKVVKINC